MRGVNSLSMMKVFFICKVCKKKIEHYTRMKINKKEYCDPCTVLRKRARYVKRLHS